MSEDYFSRNISFENSHKQPAKVTANTGLNSASQKLGIFMDNEDLLTHIKKSTVNNSYNYKLNDEVKVLIQTQRIFMEENYLLKVTIHFQNVSHLTLENFKVKFSGNESKLFSLKIQPSCNFLTYFKALKSGFNHRCSNGTCSELWIKPRSTC